MIFEDKLDVENFQKFNNFYDSTECPRDAAPQT